MIANLEDIVVPVAVFGAIAYIVKVLSDNRTRKHLIEKGLVGENVKYLFPEKQEDKSLSSIKWGMVLIGLGLAIFIGQIVKVNNPEIADEMTIGGMFILSGLALLVYYFIANRMAKKSKSEGSV